MIMYCSCTVPYKLPNFRFWPIFPYKTPKTYFSVTSLQPRGYIAE